MEEIFKIIKEYPAYRISNLGRIQTRWKMGGYYNGYKVKDEWKDLKPYIESDGGYPSVCLSSGTIKKRYRIHNLVAKAFLGKQPKNKPIVRHIDSNPLNNCVTNLVYGTYYENEQDKIDNGTWNTRYGGAKITPLQVKEIRLKLGEGKTQESLATEYGVSRATINRIFNNKIWKDESISRL